MLLKFVAQNFCRPKIREHHKFFKFRRYNFFFSIRDRVFGKFLFLHFSELKPSFVKIFDLKIVYSQNYRTLLFFFFLDLIANFSLWDLIVKQELEILSETSKR